MAKIKKIRKPETIENDWGVYYRDFAEEYDKLGSAQHKQGDLIESISKLIDLNNKLIVDIGSGTGRSTFGLCKYGKFVYGIEPEDSMMKIAIKNAKTRHIKNVKFLKGVSEKMPLSSHSMDVAVGITSIPSNYSNFSNIPRTISTIIKETSRIVKKNGYFAIANIPPGWAGGELHTVVYGKTGEPEDSNSLEIDNSLKKSHFGFKDVFLTSEYGSVRKAIEAYGFIFGSKAIAYLKRHKKTSIKWKFRIYYKQL